MRAYVTATRDIECEVGTTPVEVSFSFRSEEGFAWASKEHAESQRPVFDSYKITVDWAIGGEYVCKDFQVEQRSPGEFVIFCEGPFTSKIPKLRVS